MCYLAVSNSGEQSNFYFTNLLCFLFVHFLKKNCKINPLSVYICGFPYSISTLRTHKHSPDPNQNSLSPLKTLSALFKTLRVLSKLSEPFSKLSEPDPNSKLLFILKYFFFLSSIVNILTLLEVALKSIISLLDFTSYLIKSEL